MKEADVQKLKHGLYVVHWNTGGTSLAAVGSLPNGHRWLAPTNWCGGMGTDGREIWRNVERVRAIAAPDTREEG